MTDGDLDGVGVTDGDLDGVAVREAVAAFEGEGAGTDAEALLDAPMEAVMVVLGVPLGLWVTDTDAAAVGLEVAGTLVVGLEVAGTLAVADRLGATHPTVPASGIM